jgi:hypothetical protein
MTNTKTSPGEQAPLRCSLGPRSLARLRTIWRLEIMGFDPQAIVDRLEVLDSDPDQLIVMPGWGSA